MAELVARPDHFDQRRWTADAERRDQVRFTPQERTAVHDIACRVHWLRPEIEDAPARVINELHRTVEAQREALERGDTEAERWMKHASLCLRLIYAGKVRFRVIEQPGQLYTVRLHVRPEALLDWDRPIEAQSDEIRRAMGRLGFEPSLTGEAAYRALTRDLASKQGATEALVREGLEGIQYLDGFSRDGSPDGTRNYVVFDETAIVITHRNGLAVAGVEEIEGAPIAPAEPRGGRRVEQRMAA